MLWGSSHPGRRPGTRARVLQNRNVTVPESEYGPQYPCQVTETNGARPKDRLRSRFLSEWEYAADETARSGLLFFIAVVPEMPIADGLGEPWPQFTAALAYSVHRDQGTEQTIVLFTEADSGAKSQAYLVDDNGPVTPKQSGELMHSKSDDFCARSTRCTAKLRSRPGSMRTRPACGCRCATAANRICRPTVSCSGSSTETALCRRFERLGRDPLRLDRLRPRHRFEAAGQMTSSRGIARSQSPGMTRAGRATSASA